MWGGEHINSLLQFFVFPFSIPFLGKEGEKNPYKEKKLPIKSCKVLEEFLTEKITADESMFIYKQNHSTHRSRRGNAEG